MIEEKEEQLYVKESECVENADKKSKRRENNDADSNNDNNNDNNTQNFTNIKLNTHIHKR